MLPQCRRFTRLVLAGALSASALDFSGTVQASDGTPKAGVKIVLASTGDSSLTNASGAWTLGSTTSASRRIPSVVAGGRLAVREGRLSLRYGGIDAAGRSMAGREIPATGAQCSIAARTASVPDTLVYSFLGRVFLRDTVSAARSGISRVFDTTWNAAIVYGYLTDGRDGQTYRTVKIGPQIWMAQNLNVKLAGSDSGWAYENSPDSARKYGRLYTWAMAMGLSDTCDAKVCSTLVKRPQQGLCPEGWHVPSDAESRRLTDTSVAPSTSGRSLKSRVGWTYPDDGADSVGFHFLPAGCYTSGTFMSSGTNGGWWSDMERGEGEGWGRFLNVGTPVVYRGTTLKWEPRSVRCLQNLP